MADYKLLTTSSYKKDLKKYLKDPKNFIKISKTLLLLAENGALGLPENMRAHLLKGNFAGTWECHIKPDLLLMWLQIDEEEKTIKLLRIGSHAELFK